MIYPGGHTQLTPAGVPFTALCLEFSRDGELLAGSSNFRGSSRAGFLASAARLRGTLGRFADEFHGHEAGDELLHADAVEINRRSLGVGFGYDSVSILVVLDALPFGKNLHNCLLICHWHLRSTCCEEASPPRPQWRTERTHVCQTRGR
jgi:hypothetical protein